MVTAFGCLGGALMIGICPFCSSRFCITNCLTTPCLLPPPRGQNTSCEFQQQEAGVTPEARRDRAAILRRGGVAPASGRVLAAVPSPCLLPRIRCSFRLLSTRRGDVVGGISGETCCLRSFHLYVHG